jgi:hypothetical protein
MLARRPLPPLHHPYASLKLPDLNRPAATSHDRRRRSSISRTEASLFFGDRDRHIRRSPGCGLKNLLQLAAQLCRVPYSLIGLYSVVRMRYNNRRWHWNFTYIDDFRNGLFAKSDAQKKRHQKLPSELIVRIRKLQKLRSFSRC